MVRNDNTSSTMAERIALAASALHEQRTGHAPSAVTVVLGTNTLVITLHEALSEAEKNLAQDSAGSLQVQEFHRQLFRTSSMNLREEIRNITGVKVREAACEIELETGAVIHAFTSGTMVQVLLLDEPISLTTWNKSGRIQ